MLTSYQIFKNLPGVWVFNRTLINIQDPKTSGEVSGLAEFRPMQGEQNLLQYYEVGTFVTNAGDKWQIKKEYFFAFNEKTYSIEKYFAKDDLKDDLFYALNENLEGAHNCGQDKYVANYKYENDDFKEFSLTYKVTGPHKNYISETKYNCRI